MTVRPRGSRFLADVQVGGARYRRSFPDHLAAHAWELEARGGLLQGRAPSQRGRSSRMELHELVSRAATGLWPTGSDRSLLICQTLAGTLGRNRSLEQIQPAELTALTADLKPSTQHRYRAAWLTLVRWAQDSKLASSSADWPREWPRATLRVVDGAKEGTRDRFLTPEEAERLLHHSELAWIGYFRFLLHTGARASEGLLLRWRDISAVARTVTFPRTKSGRQRSVPLTAAAELGLSEAGGEADDGPWRGEHGKLAGSDWSIRRAYRRASDALRLACEKAGLEGVTLHTLRHTFASWFVQKGGDLLLLSRLLGHSSVRETERYAHLEVGALERARGIIDG